jgi:ATP-dependent helicase/nuclease subunit A
VPEVAKAAAASSAEAGLPPWIGSAPDWRTAPPAPEPARPQPLAPSRPEGVALGPVPPSASPLVRQGAGRRGLFRGEVVHTLLEHLPALPAAAWPAAARRYLERSGSGSGEAGSLAADDEIDVTIQEVLGVLRHPGLAPLFGPEGRAEVPLTGVIGNAVIGGVVDRLAVLPDGVLVADFKTNRRPPARITDTPILYLRQMASYRAVLRIVFPDRPVRCALVWTASMQVAMLPDVLLDKHDPSHETGAA